MLLNSDATGRLEMSRRRRRFLTRWCQRGGDRFTVNAGQYWPNDDKRPFANRHAASLRALCDSNLENSQFIYQTGQSGLVFSDRYRDMSSSWAKVQYRSLQLNRVEIRHSMTLVP